MKNLIRRDLANFKPYKVAEQSYELKLDANESPYNLPEAVREKLIDWLKNSENLNIYPDTDCNALREELSKFWNVSKDEVICGVGSDQLIDYLTKVFLEPGDSIVVEKPTFSMYKISALLNHGNAIEMNLGNDYELNADEIIGLVNKENPKILFLCTPNNPTGNCISESDLHKIISSVNCVVAVDEAYAEFSGQTMIPFINKYKNMIVFRTFSKAFGLAGARVGYAIACSEMIDVMNIVKAPYNLNTFSQILAIEALKESEVYKERIKGLIAGKDWLYNELIQFDCLKVFKSDANFIYVKSSLPIAEKLEDSGVLVRKFTDTDGEELRISCGDKKQNEIFIDKLKKIING